MPTQQNDGIAINRVVERVKCELGSAVRTEPKLLSWIGNITLTLEVDQAGAVMPSATLTGPFGAGAFGLDLAAGASSKTIQTSLVTMYFPVHELLVYADRCPVPSGSRLDDPLGLQQWVERTFQLGAEGGAFKDKDKAIGYTIEFDLELSAGVTPSFVLSRVNGKDGLSVSRKTANTLQVALADAGIVPPRRVTRKRIVEESETQGGRFRGEDSPPLPGTDSEPARGKRKKVVTETTTSKATPADPAAQRRLDAVIQQLQLKTLRLRP